MIHVALPGRDIIITARQDATLAGALRDAGHPLNTRCGERGSCRGCMVLLGPGVYTDLDGHRLEMAEGAPPREERGCRWRAQGAVVITVPAASLLESTGRVVDEMQLPPFTPASPVAQQPLPHRPNRVQTTLQLGGASHRVRVLPAGVVRRALGVAIDIGTTTVATALVDLADGSVVARAGGYNQQNQSGADVATRIGASMVPGGLERLRRQIVEETLNPLLRELAAAAGCHRTDIVALSVAANTVMTHLMLGHPVEAIGRIPFTPLFRHFPVVTAAALGLWAARGAAVACAPAVSGYVGGDITAGVYTSGLLCDPRPSLFIDIGTNGEIVYTEGGRMLATATAAGPAFEGGGITHGCRAMQGAIESARLGPDGRLQLGIIGSGRARGICGSGLIDLVAVLRRAGVVNRVGRLQPGVAAAMGRLHHPPDGKERGFVVVPEGASADGPAIILSERDIAELLKAKSALRAGILTLLDEAGRSPADVANVHLAGGFARHINPENAVAIGLIPRFPSATLRFLGNSSLAGAYLTLTDPAAWETMRLLADLPRTVELNRCPTFEDHYIDSLMLPGDEEDEP